VKLLGLIVLIFSLSSCNMTRALDANKAKKDMIGMSKKELLICAGLPTKSQKIDNIEFLMYNGGANNTAGGILGPKRYCEATFTLEKNIITKIDYRGNTGGFISKGERCAYIVKDCISRHKYLHTN